jgi:hypothetical protein
MPDQQNLNISMKSAVHNGTAGFFMPHDARFLSQFAAAGEACAMRRRSRITVL